MKLQNLSGSLLLILLTVVFTACSDNEREPYYLSLSVDKCEAPIGRNSYIPILSGNGDYAIKVANNEIVEAKADFSTYPNMAFGVIRIQSKQKGETIVTVTDNITRDVKTLKVKVTDNFVGFRITESDHQALSKERWVYLVDNERKDAYFFEKGNNGIRGLLAHGSYQFTVESSIPYLTLYYSESNGQFTDATIAPVPHKFNIKDNKEVTFNLLSYMLHVDWGTLGAFTKMQYTRTSVTVPVYMRMKAEDTDKVVTAVYDYNYIPQGVLQD